MRSVTLGDTMKLAAFVTALALALMGAGPALAQLTDEENAAFDRALAIMGDDRAEARRLIEPLAAKGDGESLNFLAMLVLNDGPGWEADPERAAALREQAVAAGSEAAALNIATELMMNSEADHARAVELLRMADTEERLKPMTAYPWGRAYLFGWGVDQDMAKGVAYLDTYVVARDGFVDDATVDAHFLLGRAYRNGWDVRVDARRAYRHFLYAADEGDPRAQWNVGMMLLQGEGVKKDEEAAYRYVKLSAEAGHIDGMTSHAVMLALGQGVEIDAAAAREWYMAAAEEGSAHAMRGLGGMLLSDEGGEPDPALGIALLELAAEAGDELAPRILAFAEDMAGELREEIDAARSDWLAAVGPPDPVE